MTDSPSPREPYILFQLAATTYAIPSRLIQQVDMIEQVTAVPNASPAVDGIVLSRGKIIPAFNLGVHFGLSRRPYDLHSRLIVLRQEQRLVGLVVDAAREFVWLATDAIQPPPDALSEAGRRYVQGIVSQPHRLILLLDAEFLLASVSQAPVESASLLGGESSGALLNPPQTTAL